MVSGNSGEDSVSGGGNNPWCQMIVMGEGNQGLKRTTIFNYLEVIGDFGKSSNSEMVETKD